MSTKTTLSYHNSAGVIDRLHHKVRDFTDNSKWQSSQTLSLLLKQNARTSKALSLDSKTIPDANDLDKILDIPRHFQNHKITVDKLAKKMHVGSRMAMYYLDSAEMLGLIQRIKTYYIATNLVFKLDAYPKKDRPEIVLGLVRELPVVKAFQLYLENISKTRFSINDITQFLKYGTDLSPSTAKRRASTLYSWLNYGKNKNSIISKFSIDSKQSQISEFVDKFSM